MGLCRFFLLTGCVDEDGCPMTHVGHEEEGEFLAQFPRIRLRISIRGKNLPTLIYVVSLGRAFMEREMRLRGISTSNTVTLTCWFTWTIVLGSLTNLLAS